MKINLTKKWLILWNNRLYYKISKQMYLDTDFGDNYIYS